MGDAAWPFVWPTNKDRRSQLASACCQSYARRSRCRRYRLPGHESASSSAGSCSRFLSVGPGKTNTRLLFDLALSTPVQAGLLIHEDALERAETKRALGKMSSSLPVGLGACTRPAPTTAATRLGSRYLILFGHALGAVHVHQSSFHLPRARK